MLHERARVTKRPLHQHLSSRSFCAGSVTALYWSVQSGIAMCHAEARKTHLKTTNNVALRLSSWFAAEQCAAIFLSLRSPIDYWSPDSMRL